ncbi:hypothetical protein HPB49_022784 [Dermacentor silvarum]|uniref:Uncharacterized protein n=1 Tax=Dermacentor silvarum TaxID=543639 RepID=A0ACB8D0H7_DERSI|nr:hypothetical protein HPB49_022784 [Dermacentor silvarum]
METYQAENTNRFACIERTLQPIVSHPTFEPLFAQNPPNQKTPYTPTQSWPPTQQQQWHQAKQAVIQRYIAHVTSKPDVILPQERLTDAPSLPGGGTSASPMAEACCSTYTAIHRREYIDSRLYSTEPAPQRPATR